MGATCKAPYCTFTKASDAPAGGGSGAGGSGTAGSGTAGSGTAGSGTAGTGTTPPPADEGGCSLSVPGRTNTGIALGLGVAGLALALLRRRR
jgi:MYXO-CTERM domain-containing protein